MRALHCIYDDPANPWVGGGGALRVFEIYRRLAPRLDATVASGNYPGAVDGPVDGVAYRRLGVTRPYPLSRLSYAAAATRLLERGDYDVGLLDFSGYTPVRLPANGRTALVVHMLHGTTSDGRWGRFGGALLRTLERAMLGRPHHICVTSHWLRDEIRAYTKTEARFHLVRSGVPDEFFAVERAAGDFLLYYGRFDVYQKGLDVLLDALEAIGPAGPPARLLGRGRDAARLHAMIRERGLERRVSIVENPTRQAVLEAMARAILLVHPSRFEGLPMVPAEAMAAGVPVIATDVGAVAEVLDAGRAGLLIPPSDGTALADALHVLAHDARRCEALAAHGREAAARFRWDRVAEDHLAFLREVARSGN